MRSEPFTRIVVSALLILGLCLATLSGWQTRTSAGRSSPADAAPFPVEETTIAQLHAAYLGRKTTAHEITQAYINRIVAYDKRGPYLNSIITLNDHALADADKLDASLKVTGKLTGPLHGIPIIVKDNLDTFDLPTTSGVMLFKDFVPPKDAFVVERIRKAGAIVLAKASLSELAMGLADTINSVLPGFTRNPYNTDTRAVVQAVEPEWRLLQTSARLALGRTPVAACVRRRQSTISLASGRRSAL